MPMFLKKNLILPVDINLDIKSYIKLRLIHANKKNPMKILRLYTSNKEWLSNETRTIMIKLIKKYLDWPCDFTFFDKNKIGIYPAKKTSGIIKGRNTEL